MSTPVRVPLGCPVLYTLTEQDAQKVNGLHSLTRNPALAGDVFPAIVVRTWPHTEAVNLQVFIDGAHTLWCTSRSSGDGPGTWAWPAGGTR